MTALPKLERLLLDADLDVDIQPYLEALGFRTRFALHIEADERSDVALLRWAREHNHILVCHDKHRDRSTRIELYPELKDSGGKILRVTGDSSQEVLSALGKIVISREKWRDWFRENDGIIILKMDGVLYRPAHDLYETVQHHLEGDDAAQRILNRTPASTRKVQIPVIPPEQSHLAGLDPSGDEPQNLSA